MEHLNKTLNSLDFPKIDAQVLSLRSVNGMHAFQLKYETRTEVNPVLCMVPADLFQLVSRGFNVRASDPLSVQLTLIKPPDLEDQVWVAIQGKILYT